MRFSAVVIFMALLWFGAGCSKQGATDAPDTFPAPGKMRVISVEPVSTRPVGVLIPGGSFEEWYPGAPVPSGPFEMPQQGSTISRLDRGSGAGGIALQQKWSAPDYRWQIDKRFRVAFASVQPDTDYRVEVDAKVEGAAPVMFELHGLLEGKTRYLYHYNFFEVKPAEDWQSYSGIFSSGRLTKFVLATGCFEVAEGADQSLMLDNIRLTPIGPSAPPEPVHAPDGNLILNGTFDAWVTGAPLPEGSFFGPASTSAKSVISRSESRGPERSFAVVQRWSADDSGDSPQDLFGVEVADVTPNRQYVFSTAFSVYGGENSIAVSVFGIDDAGEFAPVAAPLFEVQQEKLYSKTATFNSGPYSRLRIVTHVPKGTTKFPNETWWDNWVLLESPGAGTADAP